MIQWLLAPKRLAVFFFLLTVVAAVPGILRLKVETDATAAFLPKHGHEADVYRTYLNLFTPDFGTVIIARGEVWTPERWKALCDLSAEVENLDVADRVVGLPNADYVYGTAEAVEVRDFAELVPEAGDKLRDLALSYEPYRRILVTEDGSAIALYVAGRRDVDAVTFDTAITTLLTKYAPIFKTDQGGELFQSGDLYVNAEVSRQTQKSTLIVLISVVLMLIIAAVTTRSIVGGLLCVGTGVFATFFTFALMGYLGIPQNPFNSLVLNILIPLGTAYTIHAIEYTHRETRYFLGIVPMSGIVPFLFAAGTTVLGFGTTALTDNTNIQQFGALGAFGIMMVLYATLFLVFPLMIKSGHTPTPAAELPVPRIIQWPMSFSKRTVVILVLFLFGLTAWGMRLARVNYEPIDYLLPGDPAREDADRGTELFSRQLMPLVVWNNAPDAGIDPAQWVKIQAVVDGLKADYPDLKASWVYDQIKQLSLAFTADEATPVTMPDSTDLIAQYLLLFDEHDLQPYIDADRQNLAIVLHTKMRSSTEFRAFHEDLKTRVARAGLNAELTGRQMAFYEMGDHIAWNNIRSTFLSTVILLITFTIMVRSFRVGFIALLVNSLPVFACIGFMGLAGIDLDLGSSIVTAIALGLVVDDTGHLIKRYDRYRKSGLAPREAVELTMREHWSPVIVATFVIVSGFSVLNFASMAPYHSFSRTLSVTMLFAVLGDILLMPPLLIHFDRDKPQKAAS